MKKIFALALILALASFGGSAFAAKTAALPEIPAGSELKAQTAELTGGKKYAVYSGYDEETLRGGNGKASMAAKGEVQVFGADPQSGKVLVQYRIDNKKCRFGYVDAAAIPQNITVPVLSFRNEPVTVTGDSPVTDDPLCSGAKLTSVSENEPVTLLAYMGDWAYIESSGQEEYRGFVPAGILAGAQNGGIGGWYDGGDSSLEVKTSEDGTPNEIVVNFNLNLAEPRQDGYEEWHIPVIYDAQDGLLTYTACTCTTYIGQQDGVAKDGGAGAFRFDPQDRSLTWNECADSRYIGRTFRPMDMDGQNEEPEDEEEEHSWCVFTDKDGNEYPLFVVTKMHYGADHKVTAVTGHFERVVIGEECDEPETAEGSEMTYTLAPDFTAIMPAGMDDDAEAETGDLYNWYIDCYIGRDNYDGHELTFECDLTDAEKENAAADFWFVTTEIELNENGEIRTMQYVYVPWG